jgi:hypothetical protein
LIFVAAERGRYWVSHCRPDEDADAASKAKRFQTRDFGNAWVETARKVGPIFEDDRFHFESGTLVITLYIDGQKQYRVSLAIIE